MGAVRFVKVEEIAEKMSQLEGMDVYIKTIDNKNSHRMAYEYARLHSFRGMFPFESKTLAIKVYQTILSFGRFDRGECAKESIGARVPSVHDILRV